MIESTTHLPNDVLSNGFTALQTSGDTMSWETVLLIGVTLVVVAFLVWYFFFRSTGAD